MVEEGADAFNLMPFLRREGIDGRDIGLVIFGCAHGRNYAADATARHERSAELGWPPGDFRTAALEALAAQLPNATCVMTARR
eukprot:1570909-Alexandrium_andersonii.AAC.1